MKEKLIKNYIDRLTIDDIKSFLFNNEIILSDKDNKYIYQLVKDKWRKILYDDDEIIFNDLKNNLSYDKYNQLVQLYQTYKSKYSHYL